MRGGTSCQAVSEHVASNRIDLTAGGVEGSLGVHEQGNDETVKTWVVC